MPQRSDWEAVRRSPRRDVVAGVTVAIIALPLALAFGATSGLGAQAGLTTAIVAGMIAAIFGGSNLQVSGPTGAMTIVLVPVVHDFGTSGVLMVGMMAGLVLIVLAFARLGRYVRYLPMPVVEGFTAGIAVVIAMQQIPAALGVKAGDQEQVWAVAGDALRRYFSQPHIAPVVVAIGVAVVMLFGARWRPGVPFSLIGVAGATLAAQFEQLGLKPLGDIPAGLPAPSIEFFDASSLVSLLPAALAVATLAALESLLSATVADGMSVNEHHDPNRELFGQGLANLTVPLFGGIPATAAIARTAVNVRSGASSKLAALVHAIVLLLFVLAAAPLVAEIPLAALAGVLLATTIRMVEVSSLLALARSTRSDAAVLALTFTVTVVFNLVTAVGVGLGLAIILALRSIAQSARLDQVPLESGDHTAEEHALMSEHIVAYRIDGPLFFGAAHRFLLELTEVSDVRVIILRMSRTSTIDATGAQVLGDAINRIERHGITVLLSGISDEHNDVLKTLGVATRLHLDGRVFADTPTAIQYARELLRLAPRVPAPRHTNEVANPNRVRAHTDPETARLCTLIHGRRLDDAAEAARLLMELHGPETLDGAWKIAFPHGDASTSAINAVRRAWDVYRHDRYRGIN
ncbi:MAG: SulP family inorganic anion transporter [Actinomycetota bacterium]|nr:SulP family inorganic anion transporter [Actinomycetota bacterium]